MQCVHSTVYCDSYSSYSQQLAPKTECSGTKMPELNNSMSSVEGKWFEANNKHHFDIWCCNHSMDRFVLHETHLDCLSIRLCARRLLRLFMMTMTMAMHSNSNNFNWFIFFQFSAIRFECVEVERMHNHHHIIQRDLVMTSLGSDGWITILNVHHMSAVRGTSNVTSNAFSVRSFHLESMDLSNFTKCPVEVTWNTCNRMD